MLSIPSQHEKLLQVIKNWSNGQAYELPSDQELRRHWRLEIARIFQTILRSPLTPLNPDEQIKQISLALNNLASLGIAYREISIIACHFIQKFILTEQQADRFKTSIALLFSTLDSESKTPIREKLAEKKLHFAEQAEIEIQRKRQEDVIAQQKRIAEQQAREIEQRRIRAEEEAKKVAKQELQKKQAAERQAQAEKDALITRAIHTTYQSKSKIVCIAFYKHGISATKIKKDQNIQDINVTAPGQNLKNISFLIQGEVSQQRSDQLLALVDHFRRLPIHCIWVNCVFEDGSFLAKLDHRKSHVSLELGLSMSNPPPIIAKMHSSRTRMTIDPQDMETGLYGGVSTADCYGCFQNDTYLMFSFKTISLTPTEAAVPSSASASVAPGPSSPATGSSSAPAAQEVSPQQALPIAQDLEARRSMALHFAERLRQQPALNPHVKKMNGLLAHQLETFSPPSDDTKHTILKEAIDRAHTPQFKALCDKMLRRQPVTMTEWLKASQCEQESLNCPYLSPAVQQIDDDPMLNLLVGISSSFAAAAAAPVLSSSSSAAAAASSPSANPVPRYGIFPSPPPPPSNPSMAPNSPATAAPPLPDLPPQPLLARAASITPTPGKRG